MFGASLDKIKQVVDVRDVVLAMQGLDKDLM